MANNAKKLKSGSWRCQAFDHMDGDKKVYLSFTAETKKEAEMLAAKATIDRKSLSCVSKMTVGQAFDKYINNRSSVLSPASIREYKRSRDKIFPELMDVKIRDLTQDMVQAAVNEESAKLSPKTVRDDHGLLSSVLKRYRPNFRLNTQLPMKRRPKLNIPSDSDVEKLLNYVSGTDIELPILLAAYGPMRRGEICALRSTDIEGDLVHVQNAIVLDSDRNFIEKGTKNYAGDRFIKFPDFIMQKLKACNGKITDLDPNQITRRFERAIKQSGVKHFRFHDLRHYSASSMHAIGIPDQYIMARGGWKTRNTLDNIYLHSLDDVAEKMNNKINSHFEKYHTKYHTKLSDNLYHIT